MEREELARRAQRVMVAWNSRDPMNVALFYAPDCTTRDSGQRPGRNGRAGVVDRAQSYFRAFVDFDLRLSAVSVDGMQTFSRWLMRGTHTGELYGIPPTGRKIEIEGCSVHDWNPQGYIQHETIFRDRAPLLRLLGATGVDLG